MKNCVMTGQSLELLTDVVNMVLQLRYLKMVFR